MRASELVRTEQEVLTPYDSVAKAARLMRGRGVAVLGVVQDRAGRRALGAVSDRQLLLECVAAGHEPRRCPVWQHVQQDVPRVSADREVGEPTSVPGGSLLERQPLLVVDEDERLVGVVEPPAVALAVAARLGLGRSDADGRQG